MEVIYKLETKDEVMDTAVGFTMAYKPFTLKTNSSEKVVIPAPHPCDGDSIIVLVISPDGSFETSEMQIDVESIKSTIQQIFWNKTIVSATAISKMTFV